MTWAVPLALIGLAVAIVAVFTTISARKRHHASAAPAVVVGPAVLVHDINDDRCTGCDACVAVCPTNVLDLVNNKSRVLRFADCIQCEACMHACPTDALVMFPEGTVPPPLLVPEMDENFQTAVPGQYLIGEVAGKPLVKNAANLGRMVIEHMLASGLRPGAIRSQDASAVDVAIIGSGPGGLSAALTCLQRGLSFVILEKEQVIASTISRYPKGKWVMAEPYDTENYSLLPVFDAAKEELVPVWQELLQRCGVAVKQGEVVETVKPSAGGFDVRTTVAAYRAARVVLAIGTRGKPRTLQVPGENLPKVFNLLEDPDEWRGRHVLVIGGGDSAVEASLALADAGAIVTLSYRGKSFARCAPKNKQAVDDYAAQNRMQVKLQSQVVKFESESVVLRLDSGGEVQLPNHGAFVLIGADPPVAWLEKLGVKFVERPHQYQLGKSDDLVRRFVPHAQPCPQDAAQAAAAVLGGSVGVVAAGADLQRVRQAQMPPPAPPVPSGPRKWLRSATNLFSSRPRSESAGMPPAPMMPPPPPRAPAVPAAAAVAVPPKDRDERKLAAPVPLSEFARQQRTGTQAGRAGTQAGRRDALSAGERTRILRMLRDEGARLADEDSGVYIGMVPSAKGDAQRSYDLDLDDPPAPAPAPVVRARPQDATRMGEPVNPRNVTPRSKGASAPPPPPGAASGRSDPAAPAMLANAPRKGPPSAPPPGRGAAADADGRGRGAPVSVPPPPGRVARESAPPPMMRPPGPPAASALPPALPAPSGKAPAPNALPQAPATAPRRNLPPPFASSDDAPVSNPAIGLPANLRSLNYAAADEATSIAQAPDVEPTRPSDRFLGDGPTAYDPPPAMARPAPRVRPPQHAPRAQPLPATQDDEDFTSIADTDHFAHGQVPYPGESTAAAEERTTIGEAPKRGFTNVDWDIE